jgi:hypothetical protein
MNRLMAKLSAYGTVFAVWALPLTASAQLDQAQERLDVTGETLPGGGGDGTTLPQIVGNFINVVIGLLGIIFVVEVVYAGFLYLTAGGETDKVGKAKDMLRQGVIGIILIVLSYVIANFVIDALGFATGQNGQGSP